MYAKLNNGVLEYAPVNYILSDGRVIVNFNKSITLMTKYGFKEVIDERPVYNQETEYLVNNGYTETDMNIIINYTVEQIKVLPTLEDKIKSLEVENKMLKECVLEMSQTVYA